MKTRSSERLISDSSPHPTSLTPADDADAAALKTQKEGRKVHTTSITVVSKQLPQQQHTLTNLPITSPARKRAMQEEQAQHQRNSGSSHTASPTDGAATLLVEDSQRVTDHVGNASPVQLTELVSSGAHKSYSPPSDRNHNVTAVHVVSPSGASKLSASFMAGTEAKDNDHYTEKYADRVGAYSAEAYREHVKVSTGVDGFSAPAATEHPVYHSDSPYQHQYSFAGGACKSYRFSAADTASEYSSPEMAQCSQSDDSAYTPPVTVSNASSGSPDPIRWSPEVRSVSSARDTYNMLPAAVGPNSRLQETARDSQSYLSGNSSSAHTAYYSDEQSLEGDSMHDIQQEILRADIQRHIYESYSQSLNVYQTDEECLRETENVSPANSSTERKSSSGSKKRRRRMQTPVQRKAANMRERKRMCHLNVAFDHLKDRLPNVRSRKKLSRIQTLRAAIFYISLLSECLQSS